MGDSPSARPKAGRRIATPLTRRLGYVALDPDDTACSLLLLQATSSSERSLGTEDQAHPGSRLLVLGTQPPVDVVRLRPFERRGHVLQELDRPSERRLTPLDHDEPVVAFEAEASGLAHGDALTAHQVIAQEDVRLLRMSRRKSEHSIHASPQGSVRNKE